MMRLIISLAFLIALGPATAGASPPPASSEAATNALSEMSMGAADAPLTVIEYASLTCGHCAKWHKEVWPTIKQQYVDTGRVRFILREMPVVPAHPALIGRSYAGSMLARCAADKSGKAGYFAVMGTLFEHQEHWAFGDDPRGSLLKIAADANIDAAAFQSCIAREDIKALIDKNVEAARTDYQIQGTPGFIIDGRYQRIFTIEEVSTALDEALEGRE